MKKKIHKLLFCAVGMLFIVTGCGKQEEVPADIPVTVPDESFKLQNCKVLDAGDTTTAENVAFLISEASAEHGMEMEKGNEIGARTICLITENESAQKLGYSFAEWNENGFVVLNEENIVYILSPTDSGIKRATTYFLKEMIASDGSILLEDGEKYVDLGKRIKGEIFIGETSIEQYQIVYNNEEALPACRELRYHIQQTCNDVLNVAPAEGATGPVLKVFLDESLSIQKNISIEDGQVCISAKDLNALSDAVYLFTDTYLGWIKAGGDEATISSKTTDIHVPANMVTKDAWIEEREAIICLWNVNYTRGAYLDSDISLKNNIIDFSEEQLYDYVKMLKYCGFTGIQVTEMCSTWAGVGDYEIAHEKIRILAEAAHSLDMKFTLWVWGSEFADCAWVDNTVTYDCTEEGFAHQNPEVVETFEKYYSIYAELADCCDRVIGHYYDPGNLHNAEDIAFFAKMLKDKFHAINPDIDFGISCWVDIYDKQVFIDTLGTDITLYESGYHANEEDYVTFREEVRDLGCRMGTWAWNTCEMEIDQLAQMNFNMEIIRSVYQTARNYDDIMKPTYWSEMDSYHILNVFSLYCSAQMLVDPDKDSSELFEEISVAAVGPKYAEDFMQMLSIIQDARSGYSWDTYFWSSENYILKSDSYQAEQILQRCNYYIPVLEEMIAEGIEAYELPLPISLNDLLQMMLPHMVQIRDFAEFRVALAELEESYAQGGDMTEITAKLHEISDPIKEYTCIIGAWGQIEARAQYEMIEEFCAKTGIEVPQDPVFHERRKQYILAQTTSYQRGMNEPYEVAEPYYQLGLAYGPEETNELVEELVQEGLLIPTENGSVYLADWESYIYHFD